MAVYEIEFHRVEHYYHTERIDAESVEQAKSIANDLLESVDFDVRLIDHATYDWGENELQSVGEVPDGVDHWPTMTADEIEQYLED